MEPTPSSTNVTAESTTYESSGYESYVQDSISCSETPNCSLLPRKRKLPIVERENVVDELEIVSPFNFDFGLDNDAKLSFLSSTLNDSTLANKLEKCSITSNLVPKRGKILAETPKKKKKKEENGDDYFENRTPMTTRPLGSPESNKILYSKIVEKPLAIKPKSPQKFNESLKKVNSPAKKRLFEGGALCFKKQFRKLHKDPMVVFKRENNCPKIISIIFEYLTDVDLYHIGMVSRLWKQALSCDRMAYGRYVYYVEEHRNNKENIYKKSQDLCPEVSPPCSPQNRNFRKCTKLAATLTATQSLLKCPRCMDFSVVEKCIGQCQNIYCEYIWCTNCSSFSTTGPADFKDKCKRSKLLYDSVSYNEYNNRRRLSNISNAVGSSSSCLFLRSTSGSNGGISDSSGYDTNGNESLLIGGKPLAVRNAIERREILQQQKQQRRLSLIQVVDSDSPPPPSPPSPSSSPTRVTYAVGSKQSKKNLRRLNF